LKYLILLLVSFPTLADITFVNVSQQTQQQFRTAVDEGIPVFYSEFDTGEKSSLKSSTISKVTQLGNVFLVCTNPSSLYKVKFKCFKKSPCRFITNGSVLKARTVHQECQTSD